MFEIVREAGLLPHEVAKMLKVSRVTVSMWVNGHCKPHRLLIAKVERFLDGVQRAVDVGDLPLDKTTKRKDRLGQIKVVLVKHLHEAATGK